MAKQRSGKSARRRAAEQAARAAEDRKRMRKAAKRLERRVDELVEGQRALRKRVKRLTRRLEAGPPPPPPPGSPGAGAGSGPDGPPGRTRGAPPWAEGIGPVVSLEVPLETDDPAAPLWATVAARLPTEIATVADDGRVVRYRYSAVGSTPQAPRYRRLSEPPPNSPEAFPG